MIIGELLPLLMAYWPIVLAASAAAYLLNNKFYKGLNKYPGVPIAAYTNWWRFFEVWGQKTEYTHVALHKQHGDIVRLGPNVLSFADPKAIKIIYGLNKGMTKSDFYPVQQAVSKGKRLQSLFSTTFEDYHAKYRRCVNGAFAMSSLVEYEPLVDSTTDVYIERTKELYCGEKGQRCDFTRWLQFYAFDVIGELTWSKRLGYIEKDQDVDGIIEFLNKFLSYAAPIGQMPFLDLLLEKNPLKLQLEKWGINKKVFPVTKFALDRSGERKDEMQKVRETGIVEKRPGRGIDLLTKFNQAQHDHPEFMTDAQVLAASTSMVFAGSETTAISLSSIFYHLVRHPKVYEKLMQELDDAAETGAIQQRENNKVSWAESQKLPYLDAVIQESFRMHPAAGLILERITPAQGIEICGEHIPGGVIVGCNSWVLHRRPEVFGADVETFRPERWIDADPLKLKEMKATMFQFGAGARTCIGKNISLLEIYKLVPTFLRTFEIEMACDDWKTRNACLMDMRKSISLPTMPDITLYFLQASRSIRTAWQLEELGLDYKLEFSERESNKAPQHFKDSAGDALGKFPLLKDGDLLVGESGAIAEYLCEQYDTSSKLLPKDAATRVQCLRWVHAAEATYALHGLAILYTRWFGADNKAAADKIEEGMSVNVCKDMDFLENELGKSQGKFLVGDDVTVADCMMLFSAQFILARQLGTKGKKWEKVDKWIADCEETESYKRAVEKTGHKL
ncbi:benzoate 4-monooxygenase cytochrome-like protein P450 [Aureobasidium subglaciale]|nr:benzoate 4-monooxygenase cytochrome-like protein P450 [Aureobasidium subglaciale]KAI5218242.1 benzoate 4-monooxygenase cytochrome-like protein P450 [Aureobasidium subglaciale]KAI5221703.1 benzoate 4-monooxygenase cytochrome-like protein P450 [Aureobasidium subglaciale]KAI5259120.1 benzoate 4-monooxygenase cytochrome-like protein P450 [Aureobasidium subglaciale]